MGPRPIVTVAVCALAALCARASGCATADCAIDIYCEAGSLIGVGVGFYSPAGNCGRFACTNKRSACTPSQWRNAAMSYTAYTTSGGGIDSCSWACAPGGHYLEIGYNPQFDCQACKPAWPGYYSPPLDNELYECPAPVGQGTLTDKEGNDSAECEVDCSGASPPYVENDRSPPAPPYLSPPVEPVAPPDGGEDAPVDGDNTAMIEGGDPQGFGAGGAPRTPSAELRNVFLAETNGLSLIGWLGTALAIVCVLAALLRPSAMRWRKRARTIPTVPRGDGDVGGLAAVVYPHDIDASSGVAAGQGPASTPAWRWAGPGALTPTPGGDYTCTSTISVVDDEVQSAGEAPSNELSTDMPPKKLAV